MSTLDELAKAEKKRDPYVPQYQTQMQGLLSQMGQTPQYDFNADPLYQSYRQQFSQLAATGQANANADTQALSGGQGTTYGAMASAQAAQQYRTTMNNIIPQLYEAALDKYDAERQNLSAQFGMMGAAEDRAYGMYRDQVSDDRADLNYYYGKSQDEAKTDQWNKEFDYTAERDKVKDEQWQKQFDESKRQFDLNYALKKAQAAAAKRARASSKKAKQTKKYEPTLQNYRNMQITPATKLAASLAGRVSAGAAAANPISEAAATKLVAQAALKEQMQDYINHDAKYFGNLAYSWEKDFKIPKTTKKK